MEFFSQRGRFWLPQERQRMVHGNLSFDEDGVRLDLDDPLRGPKVIGKGLVGGSPEAASEAVLHGRLNGGQEVTLLRAQGWSMPADGMHETWIADFALTGGLVNDDAFTEMIVSFDYLMPWVNPPGIIRSDRFSSSVTVETKNEILQDVAVSGGRTVRLISGVEGRSGDTSVHLDQWCCLKVTSADSRPILDILNEWARPLQDLLVICIGRPVRLEQVLFSGPQEDTRCPPLNLCFKAVQPATRPNSNIRNYDSPTLLAYEDMDLPFGELVGEWFRMQDRLRDVTTLLCGPYYSPFIYSSHRYASTFQSAEALAIEMFKRKEKGRTEHKERVEAVTATLREAQLDTEIASWAIRIIEGRNEKSLRQLMEELLLSVGALGQQMLSAAPGLPDIFSNARTKVAHPSRKGPDALARHWLCEALIWILRVRLLVELGVSLDYLVRRVNEKPAFQDVLRELGSRWPGQASKDSSSV